MDEDAHYNEDEENEEEDEDEDEVTKGDGIQGWWGGVSGRI